MADIAIKENVVGGEKLCGICGSLIASRPGPDLYLISEGTMQIVCHDCGRESAPNLVNLLELGNGTLYAS